MPKDNIVIRFIRAVSFLIVSKLYPYLTPENRERIASLSQRDESLPLSRASSEPDQDLNEIEEIKGSIDIDSEELSSASHASIKDLAGDVESLPLSRASSELDQDLNDDKEEIEKIKGLILNFGDEFDGIKAKVSAINVGAIESLEKAAEIHAHLVKLMTAMDRIAADNIDSKELPSASQASIKDLAGDVESLPLSRASSEPDQDLNDDKEKIEKIKGLVLNFGDKFDGIKDKVSAINIGAIETRDQAQVIYDGLEELMTAMDRIAADNIDSKELSSASQASIKNLAQEVDSLRYFLIGGEELVMPNLSKRWQDDSMGDQDLPTFRALAEVKLEKLKTTKAEKLIYDDLAPWLARVDEIDTDLLFNHYLNFLYEIRKSKTGPNLKLDRFIELLQDQRLRKQYATGGSQEIIEEVQLYLQEKEKDITINDERTALKTLRGCLQGSTDDTQWTSEHADSLLTINDLKISNAYTSGGTAYEPIFFNTPIASEFAGRPEFWKSEAVSVKNHIEGQLENYGYAQFTTRISGNHFVGGAIRVHEGENHLIIFDTLDTTGESALKIKAYLESQQIHIDSVFSQYELCGKRIQQDANNCGPLSLKIMQGLTPEACDAIIEGRQQANDFIRGLPIIKETMRDSDRWTADMGQEAGVRARIDVYDSLIDEMQTRNSTAISLINTIARERGIESPLKPGEDHSPSP